MFMHIFRAQNVRFFNGEYSKAQGRYISFLNRICSRSNLVYKRSKFFPFLEPARHTCLGNQDC